MFKALRTLAFVCVALLAMPAIASEVQGDGLSHKIFIDSHFEFTEVPVDVIENQSPFTLILIENTVTAITLAQNRTTDSASSDNRTQTVLTLDNSVVKLSPSRKFEVGWQ